MKRFSFLSVLLVFACVVSFGQTNELAPCGTKSVRSQWLKNFQKDGIDLSQRPVDFRIQLNAHLVGGDVGSVFSYELMLNSLAALEKDFDSTGIGFVVNLPIDTLRSTEYYAHNSVLDGADMMFENNRPEALNIYFLNNPAGNCGYNLPYAGIAIADQCAGIDEKTIAHEVGHALSIPHPFLGWEGGQTDNGSMPADFTVAAPSRVTYDYSYFLDTLIRDTTIIDTAIVELVARTNCYDAADGFCDTPADYIAGRWTCNQNGVSPVQQIDPDGVRFQSDGTLIMGYSDDECQSRFSDEQKAAMQAFAMAERSDWVRPMFDTNLVRGVTSLELDSDGKLLDAAELVYEALPNATHYFVQVSNRRSFRTLLVDTVVTGVKIELDPDLFEADETYFAKVYAFNDHSFRAGMSPLLEFIFPEISTGTRSIPLAEISVAPNPVIAGATLEVPYGKKLTLANWYDARGALVFQQELKGETRLEVAGHLTTGVYNLMIVGATGKRFISRVQVIQ